MNLTTVLINLPKSTVAKIRRTRKLKKKDTKNKEKMKELFKKKNMKGTLSSDNNTLKGSAVKKPKH